MATVDGNYMLVGCGAVAGVLGWCSGRLDARHAAHYHHVLLLPVLSARDREVNALY